MVHKNSGKGLFHEWQAPRINKTISGPLKYYGMELSLSGTVPIETIGQLGFNFLPGWHYGESSQQWRTLKVLWNVFGVTAEDRGPEDMQQLPFQ